MLLTYTRAMILFSNCGGLSRMLGSMADTKESYLYQAHRWGCHPLCNTFGCRSVTCVRNALISFKVYRRVSKASEIQVKIEFGDHQQNFYGSMALSWLRLCLNFGFRRSTCINIIQSLQKGDSIVFFIIFNKNWTSYATGIGTVRVIPFFELFPFPLKNHVRAEA